MLEGVVVVVVVGAIDGCFDITIDGDTDGVKVGKALGGFDITIDGDSDGEKQVPQVTGQATFPRGAIPVGSSRLHTLVIVFRLHLLLFL